MIQTRASFLPSWLGLLLCLSLTPLRAETDLDWLLDIPSPPSNINLEIGGSEADSRDLLINADLAFIAGSRLLLGYGRSRTIGNANPAIDSESYQFGLAGDPLSELSLELLADHWGQEQSLEIDSAQGSARYQHQAWSLGLTAQLRAIQLYYTLNQQSRRTEFSSIGLGGELQYFGFDNWVLGIRYLRQDYSRDTRALSRSAVIRTLSPITQSLSNSLEDDRLGLYIGYTFDHLSLNLSQTRIRSAVDGLASDYLELSGSFYLDPWNLLLRLGQQQTEASSETLGYASLGLGYSW